MVIAILIVAAIIGLLTQWGTRSLANDEMRRANNRGYSHYRMIEDLLRDD